MPSDSWSPKMISTINPPEASPPRTETSPKLADRVYQKGVKRPLYQLKGSALALDLYTWLTYRMSYLRKPTLVPWRGLRAQLGTDYARPRDFRRTALARLEDVVGAYPELRIRGETEGLRLYPSPPHVTRHLWK